MLAGWPAMRRSGRDACHEVWRRPGGKPCLRRAAEDEVGIALGLADPAVPHEGGEHSLDLQEDASAFAEAGGDSGARGLIVVAAAPWSRWGFCRAAAGPPRLKPWKPERFPAVLVPEPVQSN